ncbi:brachyurin-like [Anthonomus grandis grandis]|uniref:brachyurin-like n=1 Tax=Anthonomus grandis grandis TaxID=2921223 RepID=UPI0021660338|nr:brachyurin-like [Anthonomus grandis grandis]
MKVIVVIFGLLACAFAVPVEDVETVLQPLDIWLDAIPGMVPESRQPSSRVINGRDAPPGSFKYQAGIIINGAGFCGGSLIRANYILTAAHCIDQATETQVILGHHVIQEALNTHQVIVSRRHYVHPGWNPNVLQNDIALIKLPNKVDLNNPTIEIIQLASKRSSDFANANAVLSGWGRTSDASNTIANRLQNVNLEVLSNLRCRLAFLGQIVNDDHVCTSGSGPQGNVGACNGDSGGPLVVDNKQIGVVSFGMVRCEAGFPTVFARVSSYEDFIETTIALTS